MAHALLLEPTCFSSVKGPSRWSYNTNRSVSRRSVFRHRSREVETFASTRDPKLLKNGTAQYAIRRAKLADVPRICSLCAEAFSEAAESLLITDLLNSKEATDWYRQQVSNRTYKELSARYAHTFERKKQGEIVGRIERSAQRKAAMHQAVQMLKAEGLENESKLSEMQVKEMESILKDAMDSAPLSRKGETASRQRMWQVLLAEERGTGELLGCATVSMAVLEALLPPPLPTTKPYRVYVSNMVVKGEFRRQGIASSLLDACCDLGARWKQTQIYLHVDHDNTGAQIFYSSQGFENVRKDPWWFGFTRRFVLRKEI